MASAYLLYDLIRAKDVRTTTYYIVPTSGVASGVSEAPKKKCPPPPQSWNRFARRLCSPSAVKRFVGAK